MKRDRYALEREIGRGSAGAVWVARDTKLDRLIAIKLLHHNPHNHAGREQFEREARIIAQLKSPHIVQIFDAGLDEQGSFIVMELLQGEGLDARLQRHPQLPLRLAATIAHQVSQGLAQTHRAGIIHRDVKPANVFLAQEGGREVAKLLDFSVATLMAGALPSQTPTHGSHLRAGTPQYMSPEQFRGEADARTDLWSLAVLTYEMLTGGQPFSGESLQELGERGRCFAFTKPSARVHSLSSEVDAFFARALAADPAQRFQTAEEFSTELVRLSKRYDGDVIRVLFLDDEPDLELLLRQRFRHLLRSGKYELYFATDGRLGLEELSRRPDIDVVLTDLNMPGMDGLSFLARVPEVNPLVRVVVVSAYGDMSNIRAAMNRGAFDFLGKPIDFEDLQRTIEKCACHAVLIRKALRSNQENDMLRSLLGGGVAERLLSSLEASAAAPLETVEASVAFVDIHEFSEVRSRQAPAVVLSFLNEHFDIFITEIVARGGNVNRFVGDAVLAVFTGDDHLCRALESCLAVRARLRMLAAENEFANQYGATIGLDTGKLMIGPVGSLGMGRVEDAVLGDAVSTAARLQELAQKNEILVVAALQAQIVREYACEEDSARRVDTGRGSSPVFVVVGRRRAESDADEHRASTVSSVTQSGVRRLTEAEYDDLRARTGNGRPAT